jgi:hypothetical protein
MVGMGMGPNQDRQIVFLRPVPATLTESDALLLAAYIVSMVGDDERWETILTAVQNT